MAGPDGFGHGLHDRGLRRAARVDPVDVAGQLVEELEAEGRDVDLRVAGLVAEIIGQPGEEVQVGQVPPVPGGQQAKRDGKVLSRRVGHHFFGASQRRADVLPHSRPSGAAAISAFPGHAVSFEEMQI